MSNKKYILFIIIIISIIIILFGSAFFMIYLLTEYDDSLAIGQLSFKVALSIFITTIVFIIWIFKKGLNTKFVKEYEIEYSKRQREKRKKQYVKELIDEQYLQKLSKYKGKNSFRINSAFTYYFILIGFPLFYLFLFYFSLAISEDIIRENALGVIVFPIVTYIVFKNNIFTKLYIDKDGIKIKTFKKERKLQWSQIKTIGISVNPEGHNSKWSRLYFTSLTQKKPICFTDPKQQKNMLNVRFRPEIVHCVLKYYNGEILNLATQKKWLKYINKLEKYLNSLWKQNYKKENLMSDLVMFEHFKQIC